MCFQITGQIALKHLKQAKALARQLKDIGLGFAIEHFGVSDNPGRIIEHVPMDYLKVDGSLMQGLAGNEVLQEKVKRYIELAHSKRIATIAERVEDANTMAVLWQLGIQYIQGYGVTEPEVVLAEDSPTGQYVAPRVPKKAG